MSARGVAARLAVRSVRSAPGRSALIAAMIALPVAAAVMGGLVQASGQPTRTEQVTTELGRAQARLEVRSTPDSTAVQDPVTGYLANSTGGTTSTTYREPASALPPGTRILPIFDSAVTARTATGVGSVQSVVGEAWDPAFTGRWTVVAGTRPSGAGQVMLTRAAMHRLGAHVGGSVELIEPATRTVTVTGVIDDRVNPSDLAEVFGTAATLGVADPGLQNTSYYLPDHAMPWTEVQRLDRLGIVTFSRQVLLDPPPTPALAAANEGSGSSTLLLAAVIAIGVVFVLFEVVLLAGAAFAVTARQQQRSLAIIASVGADRSALVRIVTGAGVAIGLAGGLAGAGLGLGAGSIVMAVTADGSATQYPGWHLPLLAIVLSVVIAVVAGWLSALLPARAAAKADVLASLRGSRKPAIGRRRTPVVGIVVVAVGAAMTLLGGALLASTIAATQVDPTGRGVDIGLLTAGPVLMQVGALLAVRLVLTAAARVAAPLGIGPRLASRDLARNRGRSVPAVTAIMATVFVGIFVMCLAGASVQLYARQYQWTAQIGQVAVQLRYFGDGDVGSAAHMMDPVDATAAARSALGPGDIRVIDAVSDPSTSFTDAQLHSGSLTPVLAIACRSCDDRSPYVGSTDPAGAHLFVGSPTDIADVIGHQLSPTARATLAAGGAVVTHPGYLRNDTIAIEWYTAKQLNAGAAFQSDHPARTDRIHAVADYPANALPYGAFVTAATAARLHMSTVPTVLLATPTTMPTQAQLDDYSQRLGTLQNNPYGDYVSAEHGPQDSTQQIGWIAVLACTVIVIAAAGAAVGLSRIDNRPDADTLAAVGAPPAVQRRTAFWLALIVGGTGAVVGGGLALIPAVALALPGSPLPFAPPWVPILALTIGVPICIATASWAIRPANRQLSRRNVIA